MPERTTTPPAFVAFAIGGGLLFILGGILTTMSANARFALIAAAGAFIILGSYTLVAVRRSNALVAELTDLDAELARQRTADAGLKSRMSYTLRDPLTSIVGFADRMVSEPDMPEDERQAMLVEIRAGAREVEQVLADLAAEDTVTPRAAGTKGVVLLDDEVRSVVGTVSSETAFETRLDPVRAWGDSAQVRQILRTVVNAAISNGCDELQITTENRTNAAVLSVSAKGDVLPVEAVGALTGNYESQDKHAEAFIALAAAHETALAMDASIGHTEVFGRSHVVFELPLAPRDVKVQTATPLPERLPAPTKELTYTTAAELRPERPTSAIRFV
ncbi:MAG: hypothetical protein ACR2N2_11540 [Acidimicrobiia bacterium]